MRHERHSKRGLAGRRVMAGSRRRKGSGRRQPPSRVDGEAESTSRERSRAPSCTGPEGSPAPAAGGVAVKVKFEGTEEERLADIGASAQLLLERILTPAGPKAADKEPPQAVWGLRESVWPALSLPGQRLPNASEVRLKLLPLSRLGQMEGKSGSLVLVGWFETDNLVAPASHPLIVKTRKREADGTSKLREEYDNAMAVKPFVYDRKDSFAIPVWFDSGRPDYDILWSSCMLTDRTAEVGAAEQNPPGNRLLSADLREYLGGVNAGQDDDTEAALNVLGQAFRLLRNLHRRCNWTTLPDQRQERLVREEYAKYLRKFSAVGDGAAWGPRWAEHCWAGPGVKQLGGRPAAPVNPIWLVERLLGMTYPMLLGVVHGDLHPGNIILRTHEPPAVIDFGWSQDHAHLAKDFVLMECNLRFLSLRPQISQDRLRPFVNWLAWGVGPPPGLDGYLEGRVSLVQCVREEAGRVFGGATDWDREYLVPLFLCAFGLLRYAPQLGHQLAAVLFVESLANYLMAALDL